MVLGFSNSVTSYQTFLPILEPSSVLQFLIPYDLYPQLEDIAWNVQAYLHIITPLLIKV